jgi:hypothetical protein
VLHPHAEVPTCDGAEDGPGQWTLGRDGPFGKALEPCTTQHANGHDEFIFRTEGINVGAKFIIEVLGTQSSCGNECPVLMIWDFLNTPCGMGQINTQEFGSKSGHQSWILDLPVPGKIVNRQSTIINRSGVRMGPVFIG